MADETLTKAERWNRTHEQLRATAMRLLRERGLSVPSVAEVMKGAKLTVGGFYGHWDSKEALFDEVLGESFRTLWSGLVEQSKGDTPRERVVTMIRRYLSRTHRDMPHDGCPLPSTLSDIMLLGEPYKSTLSEELETCVAELGKILGPIGGKKVALGLIALMVGGLSLSRATAGTPISDSILEASRALAYAALDHAEHKTI